MGSKAEGWSPHIHTAHCLPSTNHLVGSHLKLVITIIRSNSAMFPTRSPPSSRLVDIPVTDLPPSVWPLCHTVLTEYWANVLISRAVTFLPQAGGVGEYRLRGDEGRSRPELSALRKGDVEEYEEEGGEERCGHDGLWASLRSGHNRDVITMGCSLHSCWCNNLTVVTLLAHTATVLMKISHHRQNDEGFTVYLPTCVTDCWTVESCSVQNL